MFHFVYSLPPHSQGGGKVLDFSGMKLTDWPYLKQQTILSMPGLEDLDLSFNSLTVSIFFFQCILLILVPPSTSQFA